jgi:DNA-binding transcriptional regulator YhcF (GntR family)
MTENNKETIEILDTTLKQGFSQIPRTVLRAKNLSLQAKSLYALLLDYAWQKGSCFPGQNRLGKDLGVHRNTIQKYLLELKDFGLIKWDRRGFKQTNIYYILSLDFLIDQQSDAQERVHQDAQSCVQPDAQRSVRKVEEVEYKKKEYKKPLTLDNDNGEINLNSFDSEAIALAEEFNDLKSIKFYQGIINKRNRGGISDDDIQSALEDTRRIIRTDQVDGTDFLKNPAGWFVSVLNKLIGKRQEKEQKEKVNEMLSQFKESFMNKTKI